MLATPDMFDMTYTQAQIDKLVNDLLLDAHGFAHKACLDGRAYGVEMLCDRCELDIKWCVRKEIIPQLIKVQEDLETEKLKRPISRRYIVSEEIDYNGEFSIQLKYSRLSKLLVKEQVEEIDPDDEFDPVIDVNPFVEQVTVDNHNIRIRRDFSPNPEKLLLTTVSGSNVLIDEDVAPVRVTVTGTKFWDIRVDAADDTVINVFNCDNIVVLAPTLEVENGSVFPCYTGTNQKIAMSREPLVVEDWTYYFFHPYVLLDTAFYEQGASLARREFYKLFETITFKKFVEVAAPLSVQYYPNNCATCPAKTTEETDRIAVEIFNAEKGIITINPCDFQRCNYKFITKIWISYLVDPQLFDDSASILLKDAIAHKVAAELPFQACNCKLVPDKGPLDDYRGSFIFMAQQEYGTTVIYNDGATVEKTRYGNLYGQVYYAQKLSEITKFKRRIRI